MSLAVCIGSLKVQPAIERPFPGERGEHALYQWRAASVQQQAGGPRGFLAPAPKSDDGVPGRGRRHDRSSLPETGTPRRQSTVSSSGSSPPTIIFSETRPAFSRIFFSIAFAISG